MTKILAGDSNKKDGELALKPDASRFIDIQVQLKDRLKEIKELLMNIRSIYINYNKTVESRYGIGGIHCVNSRNKKEEPANEVA